MVTTTPPPGHPRNQPAEKRTAAQGLTSAFIWTVVVLGCFSAWLYIIYMLLVP